LSIYLQHNPSKHIPASQFSCHDVADEFTDTETATEEDAFDIVEQTRQLYALNEVDYDVVEPSSSNILTTEVTNCETMNKTFEFLAQAHNMIMEK
jgi:hypothetical protein